MEWYDDWSTERGEGTQQDDDEDGFSDRATQGTETDERETLRSPIGHEDEVRRWGFGCADLVD